MPVDIISQVLVEAIITMLLIEQFFFVLNSFAGNQFGELVFSAFK
jgi:hypothetical protein